MHKLALLKQKGQYRKMAEVNHNPPKAVALLSGGPDSTTAAYLRSSSYELSYLHFDYGQRQVEQEKASASFVAESLGGTLEVFKVDTLTDFFTGRGSQHDVPTLGHGEAYDALPYIFGWAYSLAASYCLVIGAKRLVIGVNLTDVTLDPQFREEALRAFENSVRVVTQSEFIIDAPFVNEYKSSVLKLGDRLGVPLERTWSCLAGDRTHFGECRGCLRRQQGFYLASIADETTYKSPVKAEDIRLPQANVATE